MKSNIKRIGFYLQIFCLLFAISSINYGCESLEDPAACNGGDFESLTWLQDEIDRIDNLNLSGRAVETYIYNGEFTVFVVPCRNCFSENRPCILYRCNGEKICEIYEGRSSTCIDFDQARFVDIVWEE